MPQPISTFTVGDVVTWVTEQFGDVASVQIDTAKIIRWINMAVVEIVGRDGKSYQGRFTMNSVANQNEYMYPAGLQTPNLVKWNDIPMQPIGFEQIQFQTDSNWATEKGDPQYYSHQAGYFQLWPIPSTVKPIVIYGTALPALVTVSADLLPLPNRFFPRICEYALSKAQELDEDFQASAASRALFEDQLKLSQNSEDNMSSGSYTVVDDPDDYYQGY